MPITKLRTVFSTGAWINSVKTFYTKINEIIDYLNDNASSIEGTYTEYRAYLTQTGTNAPVEDDIAFSGSNTPFVDTIGGVWSYNGVGSYYYTKTGAFTDSSKIEVVLSSNTLNQSPVILVGVYKVDANTLELQTFEATSFSNFPLVGSSIDGALLLQPISIRVYQ